MANFGDFKGSLDFIISLLKRIDRHTECMACAATGNLGAEAVVNNTLAGTNTSVPAGLQSVIITALTTSPVITMSDASTYTLTTVGETFSLSASPGSVLPAFSIAGGTWKWRGIS